MFRATGSFGAAFYVESTVRDEVKGSPKRKNNNNGVMKKKDQTLDIKRVEKKFKKEEINIAKMKKQEEVLKKKIEKEEEARLARLKKEQEELKRRIKREEEERRMKMAKEMKAIKPKNTQLPGAKRKKEEVIVRKQIIKQENVYIRRANY